MTDLQRVTRELVRKAEAAALRHDDMDLFDVCGRAREALQAAYGIEKRAPEVQPASSDRK